LTFEMVYQQNKTLLPWLIEGGITFDFRPVELLLDSKFIQVGKSTKKSLTSQLKFSPLKHKLFGVHL